MKVIEWNVHGLTKNRCPSYVAKEIKRLDADIVILTEYVEIKNYNGEFEKCIQDEYYVFRQPQLITGNGVLIAVKKRDDIKADCRERFYKINSINEEMLSPDFLHASIEYKGLPITIIGMRVKTNKDYSNRWKQVENILGYINNLAEEYRKRIIVMGDFNNSKILGDENEYDVIQQYNRLATENYNLQLIKRRFKNAGFYVFNSTPKGNVFNAYSQICNGFPYKHDHVFVKGMNISDTEYDWSYKVQNYKRDVGRDPDHAILKANIEI